MKYLELKPEQIMTTNDFPVYNEHILKIYFRMARFNPKIIPPTPILHIANGLPLLEEADEKSALYNDSIKTYLKNNPQVEFIMQDGSHKTTALTLTRNRINVLLLGNDQDVLDFKAMEKTGDIFSFASMDSIEEMLIDKAKHFLKADFFQTIKSKTDRMVLEKVIPEYMIRYYLEK